MRNLSPDPVIEIKDLRVNFAASGGIVEAVRGLDLAVHDREIVAVVGESGSGKSVSMMAALGLLPSTASVCGSVRFRGEELLECSDRELRRIRGARIGVIFQDPMSSLNPVLTIGYQVAEPTLIHGRLGRKAAQRRAIELLDLVGIPHAAERAKQYPHELSGGMRQRVMIAMAIINEPDLLIADEPTTALDVTIQAQVLEVIAEVQAAIGMAVILITHDLGVVARIADHVVVMYAGMACETGGAPALFCRSGHPYTRGLLASLPSLDQDAPVPLTPIPGSPPEPSQKITGCSFHPRCPRVAEQCRIEAPARHSLGPGHYARCHFAVEVSAEHAVVA